MKKNFYRNLACMLILTGGLCMSTNTEAQVTVGSKGVPNQGALLDMKQEDKADGSANSKKGLGLPRVALTAVDKLDPCVATTGVAATDDAAKKSHIGLTVYNTTDNTAGAATLSEGVYAWDGAMWTQYSGTTAGGAENGLSMDGKKVVLGGPLNRPTTITGSGANTLTLAATTTVQGNLTVTATTATGTTSTGSLTSTDFTLKNNGAAAGKVLTSDGNGKGTWQTPTPDATTASNGVTLSGKDVQLGGALTKNTLITGTNTLGLDVPTTVGSTLAVTGATTLTGNLTSNGTTALKATNISGATTIASTGSLTLAGNGAAAGKVLTSDTNGKGTWQTPTPDATTASNGVTLSGKDVQLGGALTKNTLITGTNTLGLNVPTTVGSTLAVTGATTLTGNLTSNGTTALKATNISGATTIASTGSLTLAGNGAAAGKVLTSSDATGKATWQTPTYESTTASNGVTLSGSDVQLGGALTKNTLITGTNTLGLNVPTTVGSTLAVTGATTLGSTLGVTGATTLTGNLTSNGTTALKNTNVNGNLTVTGTTTLGSNIAAPVGAALNIQTQTDADPTNGGVTSNKGFMLPRVALTDVNSLNPIITGTPTDLVKRSYKGLQVYNVSTAVEGSGVRTWDGEKWLKIVTTIPPAEAVTSNIHNLIGTYFCSNGMGLGDYSQPMPFGTLQSNGKYAVVIQQDGSYSFALRLYGRGLDLVYYQGNINFYIYLVADGILIDSVEYPVAVSAYGAGSIAGRYNLYSGLSVAMTAKNIKKGAKIQIVCHTGVLINAAPPFARQDVINWQWNGVSDDTNKTPVRSSLVYYKL